MKKFAYLALLLSFGLFTVGCEKPKDKPAADKPAADKMEGDKPADDKMEGKDAAATDAPAETK
jgi:hypothetical protein